MTMPTEYNPSATRVIVPRAMPTIERGFFRTLAVVMAESPLKKKAAEAAVACGRGKSFVNMPKPMALIAIKKSRMPAVLNSEMRQRKYVPTAMRRPRRTRDKLKNIEDDPIPRSLM